MKQGRALHPRGIGQRKFNMIKVLDLFAGTQSVRKALDELGVEYEYKGIDIYSPEEENIIFDLTQDDVAKKLDEVLGDWKPDFIWASPVCNKFSMVLTGKGGNYYYEVKDNKIYPRKNWDIKVQPHMEAYQNPQGWEKAEREAKMAIVMHDNTVSIINHFGVPFAIENPANALTKYIYKDYVKNVAHYCMYGFDYKKPTAIYTNKKIDLLHCDKSHLPHASMLGEKGKPKPRHWLKNNSVYANRSSVPPKLIKHIFESLVGGDDV